MSSPFAEGLLHVVLMLRPGWQKSHYLEHSGHCVWGKASSTRAPSIITPVWKWLFFYLFIETSKMAFYYIPQEGQKALSQRNRKLERVSMPHSLLVLPGKILHFKKKKFLQDSKCFRLVSFAHSCPHENDFKYYKMCMWKEIWEIGTRIWRCLCSAFHSEHSIQTSVLSFLNAVMQRSTEHQAGNSKPAHSLTVFQGDKPAGPHHTVWQEDKVSEISELHATQLGCPGDFPEEVKCTTGRRT